MTGPAVQVTCHTCHAPVWSGGRVEETPEGGVIRDVPFADGQTVLTEFADRECPIGGTAAGCPNTTEAQETARSRDPQRLAAELDAARLRTGTVTAITANRAVVDIDGTSVESRRVAGALTVGDTVAVQRTGDRWVILGRTI